MDNSGFASVKKWFVNKFSSPDRAPTCWRPVVAGRFHFGGASRPQLRWSTTASWVGDSVTAARGTLRKTTRALNGKDVQHAGAIAFLKRVFGSRSTPGRVPTPQDLSVTKQHRNDRWDRCTASAGDWLKITTAGHRSANQRYFMYNSATVHRLHMQSTALDSSRSQLCNDTSTSVVRYQITKWRRLQKVVSYDVLHHMHSQQRKSRGPVRTASRNIFFLANSALSGKITTPPQVLELQVHTPEQLHARVAAVAPKGVRNGGFKVAYMYHDSATAVSK